MDESKPPPVTAASPRWASETTHIPRSGAQIREGIPGYRRFLAGLASARPFSIPFRRARILRKCRAGRTLFRALDGAALVGFLLDWEPARYLEIGSGNSTKFARFAIRSANLPTQMTSIDPHPRAEIDAIVDRPIRAKLQSCDPAIFAELLPGDLLFFDGSHLLTMNPTSRCFLGDMAPLEPGILVHVHDVFCPSTTSRASRTGSIMSNIWLASSPLRQTENCAAELFCVCGCGAAGMVRNIFSGAGRPHDISLHYRNIRLTGVSFWFETP